MRYVLLAYGDEKQWNAMSASERSDFERICLANDELLRKSGHLLAAEGLQHSSNTTTVRVQYGKVSLSDGPLTEANEQLIGLYFITGRDLNEAIRVAANLPQAHRGPIEVRPVLKVDPGMPAAK